MKIDRHHSHCSGVFIVNIFHTLFWSFHCWLWIDYCRLGMNELYLTIILTPVNQCSRSFIHCTWNINLYKIRNINYRTIPFINRLVPLSLKVGLSPSEKNCVMCLLESPLKIMKNTFYFILKGLFGLKIFRFCHDFLVIQEKRLN